MALTQILTTDSVSASVVNTKIVDKANADISGLQIAQTAGGTGTAITLTGIELTNGYQKTFVIGASNGGTATTINGKPLYKPGGTVAPNLTAGKAATVWYNLSGDCFFIKASAEGTATAADVLASKTFSNDDDTGLTGTMTNRGAVTITPGTTNQAIAAGYHNGSGYVAGDVDLVAGNIIPGKNIFGVDGSAPVKKFASGTATANSSAYVTVTGLNFTPKVVIVEDTNGSMHRVSTYWADMQSSTKDGYYDNQGGGPMGVATVSYGTFTIFSYPNVSVKWIAFE